MVRVSTHSPAPHQHRLSDAVQSDLHSGLPATHYRASRHKKWGQATLRKTRTVRITRAACLLHNAPTLSFAGCCLCTRTYILQQRACTYKFCGPFALTGDFFFSAFKAASIQMQNLQFGEKSPDQCRCFFFVFFFYVEASRKCRCSNSMNRGVTREPFSAHIHLHTYTCKAGVVRTPLNKFIFCCIVFGFHFTFIYMRTQMHVSGHSTR